jgi:hypothetical protein
VHSKANSYYLKARAAAAIVLALCLLFLVLPASLSAKERRGAELIVSRLDGSGVKGELIAVKPDSLLLLSEGKDVSVDLGEVHTVVMIRKSRAGLLAGIGGAAGAAAGVVLGLNWNFEAISDSRTGGALFGGAAIGAAGALLGYLAGSLMSGDPSFTVAGEPEADVARFWARLRAHSREGALPALAPAPPGGFQPPTATERLAKAAERPPDRPVQATPAAPAGGNAGVRGRQRGRFRLSLSAALPTSLAEIAPGELSGDGSFFFPYEAAPEAGPYGVRLNRRSHSLPVRIGLGPVCLAYEWTPYWSVDAEFFAPGGSRCVWDGTLGFTSSLDGEAYVGYFYHGYKARFFSFLLGLSYHPLLRDSLQRHDIEIGAAAGPAWVTGTPFAAQAGSLMLSSIGKVGFSGRVQAAYDYYFVPAVSLGFFASYRFTEKRLTGAVASGLMGFFEAEVPGASPAFERLTEVFLPAQSLKAGGLFIGLRIGLRI